MHCVNYVDIFLCFIFIDQFAEEVILAEERTTDVQRFHIIDARRRAAQKMRKLKTLGNANEKEEDTEEEGEPAKVKDKKPFVIPKVDKANDEPNDRQKRENVSLPGKVADSNVYLINSRAENRLKALISTLL